MGQMGITSLFMKNDNSISGKAAQFRPGQIVSGKILKHYPNQTAEVQIGGQKVVAQLETALSANERYWFQVQNGEGKIHLKVLDGQGVNGKMPTATPEGLLQQFQMPVTKDLLNLLQFFTKEQLPLTSETLKNAAEWLKSTGSLENGQQGLKEMFSRQLPFTKQVFSALNAVFEDDSMSTLIQSLQKELSQTTSSQSTAKLSSSLSALTETFPEKAGKELLSQLMKQWLTSNDPKQSAAAFKQLQSLGMLPAEMTEDTALPAVIRTLSDQLPAGKAETLTVLHDLLKSNQPSERQNFILHLTKLQSLMPEHTPQREAVSNLLTAIRTNQQQLPAHSNLLQKVIQPAMQHVLSDVKDLGRALNNNAAMNNAIISAGKLLLDGELSPLTNSSGPINIEDTALLKEQVKSIIKLLGFSHEHEILHALKQPDGEGIKNLDSIKSQLLNMQREDFSTALKEAADKVINRITGFQLLSQEAGPIQQYVFQIPLSFLGSAKDVTMQWSGRKTPEGKIDSDYCRILFYLDLDSLKETVVDLRVQARIVNMTVINDTPHLKTIIQPFIPLLNEGLMEHNYKLSVLEFQSTADKEKQVNTALMSKSQPTFSGLDIRI